MRIHIGPGVLTRICSSNAYVYGNWPFYAFKNVSYQRLYATHNSLGRSTTPSRKQITVVNDDGRVQWKDLSRREKAARTTQQTFNFGLILLGFVMTVRL